MTKEISAQANLLLYFDYNQGVPKGDNTSISTIWDKSGNYFNGKLEDRYLVKKNFGSSLNLSSSD